MAQNNGVTSTPQTNGINPLIPPLAHMGMILPPLDIREIVEKTANYVSRNGIGFEEKIREKEKNNSKFCFLNPVDPYYKYYEFRLEECKKGKFLSPVVREDSSKTAKNASKNIPDKVSFLEPPKFYFSVSLPAISATDLDILKLTAQFVARNGREFQTTLSQRESRNFQFDFLRPNHSLFQYFTKLVKQYTRILIPPKNTNSILKRNIENKYQLLEVIRKRVAWQKYQEEQQKLKQEEEDREKIEYAQIDWHDFVIVETIEFTNADDQMDLPTPISLNVLQSATLEQKQMMAMYQDFNTPSEDISYNVSQPYSSQIEKEQPTHEEEGVEMDIEADSDEENEAIKERREYQAKVRHAQQQSKAGLPMKIRTNYVPKALKKIENTLICPQCNLAIPSNELEEHMRIEMLDPKWKEQKAKAESKSASSNLYQEGAASNLKRMTASMYDMQGSSMSKEEMERSKRQR
ncbi:hypothetical protein PNEG_00850 [Pneumocystis murina B123]|uniref:SURP motif domain-containing protein n=1 Tax=Pneumocystis murina (strain B123) TaxID=1069680 RepID=M7PJR7_PNEMU|nr:hypothetical protein PNEG_00850 [Pneumocystis murina B123]EMR10699.1 hypothetical protein PNEG_00850 [Pneumocystis murina B123]